MPRRKPSFLHVGASCFVVAAWALISAPVAAQDSPASRGVREGGGGAREGSGGIRSRGFGTFIGIGIGPAPTADESSTKKYTRRASRKNGGKKQAYGKKQDDKTTSPKGSPNETKDSPPNNNKPNNNTPAIPDQPPVYVTGCRYAHQTSVVKPTEVNCNGHKGTIEVSSVAFTHFTYSNKNTEKLKHLLWGITVAYKGEACDKCKWMQFIWRKLVLKNDNGEAPLSGKLVRPDGDKYDLTTEADKPTWFVDKKHGGKDPFVEPKETGQGINTVNCDCNLYADTATSMILYEMGTQKLQLTDFEFDDKTKEALQKGKSILVSTFHADAFLVCDLKVCAKVAWTQTWTLDLKDGVIQKTQTPTTTGLGAISDEAVTPGGQPIKEQMKALDEQFPGHAAVGGT
jgi:hypothetical protein